MKSLNEACGILNGLHQRFYQALCLVVYSVANTLIHPLLQIPVLINLSQDDDVNLPVKPLIFALAMGACLGGESPAFYIMY